MEERKETVMGVHAPSPRPTIAGGLWLALLVTVPLSVLLALFEAARWVLGL